MEFEAVLQKVGEFGRYQKCVLFVVSLIGIGTTFQTLGYVFWAARLTHRCQVPAIMLSRFGNLSMDILANFSIPWERQTETWQQDKWQRSQCDVYDHNYWNVTLEEVLGASGNETYFPNGNNVSQAVPTVPCNYWVYDNSQYKSSIVSQWDLVCTKKALPAATQSAYGGGMMLGAIVFSILSDRFGRRFTLTLASVGTCVFSLTICFVPNVYAFLVLRLLIGAFIKGVYEVGFVIVIEACGPTWRELTAMLYFLMWALGYILVPAMAYGLRDHFHLLLALAVPTVVFVLYGFLPESPRWLSDSGRVKQAMSVLGKIAKVNRMHLPEDVTLARPVQKEDRLESMDVVKQLVKSPVMLKRSFILFFLWITNSLVYYGLSLNTSNIGGNDYVNFFIAGAVEVPAYIVYWLTMRFLGRRIPLAGIMCFCGLVLLVTIPIPDNLSVIRVALSMAGKFSITISYALVYIYAVECYPTVSRSLGLGLCSTVSRIGGTIAPFIVDRSTLSPVVSMIIMGIMSFLAGLLTFCLPETRNKPLPRTVKEAEALISTWPCHSCFKKDKAGLVQTDRLCASDVKGELDDQNGLASRGGDVGTALMSSDHKV